MTPDQIKARVHEAIQQITPTPVPPPIPRLDLRSVQRTLHKLFGEDPSFRMGEGELPWKEQD